MVSLVETGGRLLALGLITFFLIQVIFSANKLREEKTAVSVTTQYDQKRVMPSISVCFYYKKAEDYKGHDAEELLQTTLNETRQVKLGQLVPTCIL